VDWDPPEPLKYPWNGLRLDLEGFDRYRFTLENVVAIRRSYSKTIYAKYHLLDPPAGQDPGWRAAKRQKAGQLDHHASP
jgi:hypothetical protein